MNKLPANNANCIPSFNVILTQGLLRPLKISILLSIDNPKLDIVKKFKCALRHYPIY